jgi:hypothetical protein
VTLNILISVVTIEPFGLDKRSIEVQDFRRINDHLKRIYGIYPKVTKKIERSQHVGLGNTRIWTDYAKKISPGPLVLDELVEFENAG